MTITKEELQEQIKQLVYMNQCLRGDIEELDKSIVNDGLKSYYKWRDKRSKGSMKAIGAFSKIQSDMIRKELQVDINYDEAFKKHLKDNASEHLDEWCGHEYGDPDCENCPDRVACSY